MGICGNRESIEQYELVLGKAREAVLYGWNYRLKYEKDLEIFKSMIEVRRKFTEKNQSEKEIFKNFGRI